MKLPDIFAILPDSITAQLDEEQQVKILQINEKAPELLALVAAGMLVQGKVQDNINDLLSTLLTEIENPIEF